MPQLPFYAQLENVQHLTNDNRHFRVKRPNHFLPLHDKEHAFSTEIYKSVLTQARLPLYYLCTIPRL